MDLPSLDAFSGLDEEVTAITVVVEGGYKVIESNKSNSEILSLRILKSCKDDLNDS